MYIILFISNLLLHFMTEKDTCDDPDFECSEFAVCLEGPQGAYCQCITGYKPSADDEDICEGNSRTLHE